MQKFPGEIAVFNYVFNLLLKKARKLLEAFIPTDYNGKTKLS